MGVGVLRGKVEGGVVRRLGGGGGGVKRRAPPSPRPLPPFTPQHFCSRWQGRGGASLPRRAAAWGGGAAGEAAAAAAVGLVGALLGQEPPILTEVHFSRVRAKEGRKSEFCGFTKPSNSQPHIRNTKPGIRRGL